MDDFCTYDNLIVMVMFSGWMNLLAFIHLTFWLICSLEFGNFYSLSAGLLQDCEVYNASWRWVMYLSKCTISQVRLGQVRLGQVRFRLDQDRFRLDQIRLGLCQVKKLGWVRLGFGYIRLGQVWLAQRSGLIRQELSL